MCEYSQILESHAVRILVWSSLVSGTMVEVVYGHKVTTIDDIYVKLSDQAVEMACEMGPMGGTIIDMVPFCTYCRHLLIP